MEIKRIILWSAFLLCDEGGGRFAALVDHQLLASLPVSFLPAAQRCRACFPLRFSDRDRASRLLAEFLIFPRLIARFQKNGLGLLGVHGLKGGRQCLPGSLFRDRADGLLERLAERGEPVPADVPIERIAAPQGEPGGEVKPVQGQAGLDVRQAERHDLKERIHLLRLAPGESKQERDPLAFLLRPHVRRRLFVGGACGRIVAGCGPRQECLVESLGLRPLSLHFTPPPLDIVPAQAETTIDGGVVDGKELLDLVFGDNVSDRRRARPGADLAIAQYKQAIGIGPAGTADELRQVVDQVEQLGIADRGQMDVTTLRRFGVTRYDSALFKRNQVKQSRQLPVLPDGVFCLLGYRPQPELLGPLPVAAESRKLVLGDPEPRKPGFRLVDVLTDGYLLTGRNKVRGRDRAGNPDRARHDGLLANLLGGPPAFRIEFTEYLLVLSRQDQCEIGCRREPGIRDRPIFPAFRPAPRLVGSAHLHGQIGIVFLVRPACSPASLPRLAHEVRHQLDRAVGAKTIDLFEAVELLIDPSGHGEEQLAGLELLLGHRDSPLLERLGDARSRGQDRRIQGGQSLVHARYKGGIAQGGEERVVAAREEVSRLPLPIPCVGSLQLEALPQHSDKAVAADGIRPRRGLFLETLLDQPLKGGIFARRGECHQHLLGGVLVGRRDEDRIDQEEFLGDAEAAITHSGGQDDPVAAEVGKAHVHLLVAHHQRVDVHALAQTEIENAAPGEEVLAGLEKLAHRRRRELDGAGQVEQVVQGASPVQGRLIIRGDNLADGFHGVAFALS